MKLMNRLNRLIDRYQDYADRRWRKPPTFEVLPAWGRPAVYYLAPAENSPSGGVKVIYRHVEILNEMGIPAAVFHPAEGFSCSWFDHRAPVVWPNTIRFCSDDLLVVPECYGVGMPSLPTEIRKVVFNQGPHHTFDRIDLERTAPGAPYRGVENIEGILTVSEDGGELLRHAFPEIPVSVARNVIDPVLFRLRDQPALRRIAYVPTRRREELDQILHVLRSNGALDADGWELVPLSGHSESEMGDILRSSSIFMSLSDRDGFGLPPAEAMAAGCYVVGYPGGGGIEFFEDSYCRPVTDSTGMVREVLAAVRMSDRDREELGAKASARIRSHYTRDGLQTDLQRFYGRLL